MNHPSFVELISEDRARSYVTRMLSKKCPERIEATIAEAIRRSTECASLAAFYTLLSSIVIAVILAERKFRKASYRVGAAT